jgi:hypothetical protein
VVRHSRARRPADAPASRTAARKRER